MTADTTTTTTTTIFPVGCFVSIKNLIQRADLNGRKGEVIGKPDSNNGRIPVKLVDDDNMENSISVKATNLQVETCKNGFSLKTATGSQSFANMLREEGCYDEAIRFYQQALSLDENCTTAYMGIGLSQMLAGNWTEAEHSLKTCIDKENCVDECGATGAAHAYYHLSLCLEKRMSDIADILPNLDENPRPVVDEDRDVATTLRQLCQDILKYRQIASAMDPHNDIYKNGLSEWEEKSAELLAP